MNNLLVKHFLKFKLIFGSCLLLLLVAPLTALATDYHVGPGQAYTTIGSVPWYSLTGGDTVYIHYGTYREKFQISTRGTATSPIRVIGVPDANGNRPVIDGQNATTSKNNHFKWQTPNLIQWDGVVFVSINSDASPMPAYVEIKNLEIKNGYKSNTFTAENGAVQAYEGFAAGVYIRAAENVLIENCVIHDNGQGVYVWTGSGSNWWDGLSKNITLRGNYFYNNGNPGSYLEHATYTEADGVTIEYNHYGTQRPGAYGSALKDRSAGTVIRYNYFSSAPAGWVMDLVEPEGAWDALGGTNRYKQTFVYGNVIVNKGNYEPNYIHWNEDHYSGTNGRATIPGSKLLFYNNTVLTVADQSDMGWDAASSAFYLFNTQYGGYECPTSTPPGVIDVRNNIFAVQPRTAGQPVPAQRFAYCKDQKFDFGANWASPRWSTNTSGTVTGLANIFSPAANDPGFASIATGDLHLTSASSALNIAGALPMEATTNYLGQNLTPIAQYVYHQLKEVRASLTEPGAFENGASTKLSQSVTFGAAPSLTVGAGAGTLSASATSGLPVTFSSTTPTVCTVSGSQVTPVAAGSCIVAANQAGNTSYNAAPQVTQTIAVKTATVADSTLPSVTTFTMPASSTTTAVPVTALTASDNVGVVSYMISESATKPAATVSAWSASKPASFTFSGTGTRTAYAWAKDAAGNVSAGKSAVVNIAAAVADTVAPTASISSPAAGTTVSGTVTVGIAASDNVAVSKVELYVDGTLSAAIGTAPYTVSWNTALYAEGSHTLTATAYDAAGNAGRSAALTVTVKNAVAVADTTRPVVTGFSLPLTATTRTVNVTAFTASDNVKVTGYKITTSATAPLASSTWSATVPTSYTFAGSGTYTAYAWVRDAAGNVSAARSATVKITVADSTLPTISISAPKASSEIDAEVYIVASATDNVKLASFSVYADGKLLTTSTTGSIFHIWDTSTAALGLHTIKFVAVDASGNVRNKSISVYK